MAAPQEDRSNARAPAPLEVREQPQPDRGSEVQFWDQRVRALLAHTKRMRDTHPQRLAAVAGELAGTPAFRERFLDLLCGDELQRYEQELLDFSRNQLSRARTCEAAARQTP